MTDTEAITDGRRIGSVARAMLNGTMDYLTGALELEQLRHEIGAYENDPDFMPFIAIKMDIANLPNSEYLLANQALSVAEMKIVAEATSWAKSISVMNCEALAQRYL